VLRRSQAEGLLCPKKALSQHPVLRRSQAEGLLCPKKALNQHPVLRRSQAEGLLCPKKALSQRPVLRRSQVEGCVRRSHWSCHSVLRCVRSGCSGPGEVTGATTRWCAARGGAGGDVMRCCFARALRPGLVSSPRCCVARRPEARLGEARRGGAHGAALHAGMGASSAGPGDNARSSVLPVCEGIRVRRGHLDAEEGFGVAAS